MSIAIFNVLSLHAADRTLLRAAFISARNSLQDEAGLNDTEIDALTDVMAESLLSLFRTGQTDQIKLTNYVVAKTLRHLSATQR